MITYILFIIRLENVRCVMTQLDRPIKPDPKYIQQYLQKINKIQTKAYLKKKSNPLLPCNALHDIQIHQSPKQSRDKSKKTKAEIYEQIKRKNLQKFGDKKIKNIIQDAPKKLNPKKMTINYKAKPLIQTEQYKKKDYVPLQKTIQSLPDNKDKIEYEKLIDYFNNQLKQLEQEKDHFNKVAQKLKFKEKIKSQEGLFYSRVKSQVQRQLINTKIQKEEDNKQQPKTNHQSRQNMNKKSKVAQKKSLREHLSKTYSVGQIRGKLEKTCEQLQLLKSQILHQTLQIRQHRYQIFQMHLLPNFTPQAMYDYIDIAKLKYNGNSLYKAAMKAFNSKFEKENKGDRNVYECDGQCKPSIKEKFIGEKRVSKYEGWTQVWIPGKQRLMANKENYKVIWLANGDVIQEFSNNIQAYFSKVKQILKIQFKDNAPIYYHDQLKQIWRYLSDGSREIVFGNGRSDIIGSEQH